MAVDRTFRAALASFTVGWKVEGNWTDPVLFVGFLIMRPLFTFFIGVFAYLFVGSVAGGFASDRLAYIVLGSALYIVPMALMRDLGWLVHDDREHYEALKHIYLASPSLSLYLIGRSLVSFLNAVLGMLVTVVAADVVTRYAFKMDLALLGQVDLLGLAMAMALGYLAFTSMGFCMYGAGILSETAVFAFADGLPSLLLIIGGVLFPPTFLPWPSSALAYATPAYYYVELARESLQGSFQPSVLNGLVATSLTYAALFNLLFLYIRKVALKRGLLDRKSNW
jgi:hypothetical protein